MSVSIRLNIQTNGWRCLWFYPCHESGGAGGLGSWQNPLNSQANINPVALNGQDTNRLISPLKPNISTLAYGSFRSLAQQWTTGFKRCALF